MHIANSNDSYVATYIVKLKFLASDYRDNAMLEAIQVL